MHNQKNVEKLLKGQLNEINYSFIKFENQSLILKENESLFDLATQFYPLALVFKIFFEL